MIEGFGFNTAVMHDHWQEVTFMSEKVQIVMQVWRDFLFSRPSIIIKQIRTYSSRSSGNCRETSLHSVLQYLRQWGTYHALQNNLPPSDAFLWACSPSVYASRQVCGEDHPSICPFPCCGQPVQPLGHDHGLTGCPWPPSPSDHLWERNIFTNIFQSASYPFLLMMVLCYNQTKQNCDCHESFSDQTEIQTLISQTDVLNLITSRLQALTLQLDGQRLAEAVHDATSLGVLVLQDIV